MSFVSAFPDIDKDVAVAIVAQFPDFKTLAAGAVVSVQESWRGALAQNRKTHKQAVDTFNRYIDILDRELERDQLSGEDRFRIIALIGETADRVAELNSENKAWLLRGLGVVVTAGAVAVVAAVAVLGGKGEIREAPLA